MEKYLLLMRFNHSNSFFIPDDCDHDNNHEPIPGQNIFFNTEKEADDFANDITEGETLPHEVKLTKGVHYFIIPIKYDISLPAL